MVFHLNEDQTVDGEGERLKLSHHSSIHKGEVSVFSVTWDNKVGFIDVFHELGKGLSLSLGPRSVSPFYDLKDKEEFSKKLEEAILAYYNGRESGWFIKNNSITTDMPFFLGTLKPKKSLLHKISWAVFGKMLFFWIMFVLVVWGIRHSLGLFEK